MIHSKEISCIFTLSNKNKMKTQIVTPEIVEQLYFNFKNKQLFLTLFGTKKFYLVDKDFLNEMYNYLINN